MSDQPLGQYRAAWFDSPCIDLRSSAEFIKAHIRQTTSLPWDRLTQSMHELPDKHVPVQLLGTASQLTNAADFLTEKNYQVSRQIRSEPDFWQWAGQRQILESGCNSVPLWQANPFLTAEINRIESLTTGRKALDLACGAGRDAVFLATRGWEVSALDVKADALDRCQSLASAAGTTISPIIADIEQSPEALTDTTYDLIVVMRYLYRPLLPQLARMLRPGGLICYSTFMVGSEKFGSPKNPNYLLKPGELKDMYRDFSCHIDAVHSLADGRPVAHFLAQKSSH